MAITGSPGTGKHTVGAEVARIMGLEVLDLGRVAIEGGLAEEWEGGARDVDTIRLGRILAPMLGGRTLVVGHLAPYVLAAPQVQRMVVLRRSPYELSGVYNTRGYPAPKAAENIGGEILGIIAHDAARKLGPEKTAQVDSTGRTIQETAVQVVRVLGGAGGDNTIDWLSMVADRGELGRFFYD